MSDKVAPTSRSTRGRREPPPQSFQERLGDRCAQRRRRRRDDARAAARSSGACGEGRLLEQLDRVAALAHEELRGGDVDRARRLRASRRRRRGRPRGGRARARASPSRAAARRRRASPAPSRRCTRSSSPRRRGSRSGPSAAAPRAAGRSDGRRDHARRPTPRARRSRRRSRTTTSPIVGPSATASESEKNGMPRFALTEPSIGSTTTRTAPPAPNDRTPSSSETSMKSGSERLEPRDDGVLGRRVDRRRVVAALARPQHRLALDPRRQSPRTTSMSATQAAAELEPVDASYAGGRAGRS